MEIEINKVYTFKMNSGEEIAATITAVVPPMADPTGSGYYIITAPLSMAPTQAGLQMMPALFATDLNPEAHMNFHSISMVAVPREDVLDTYRESVTGIKVPKKKILLA